MTDDATQPKTSDELAAIRMENIRSHQFKPGESGNPNGRPKGKTVASEIKRIITDKEGSEHDIITALANVAIRKALKGDFRHFDAIREIIDGPKPKGGVNITGNMIQVVFEDLEAPPGFNPPRTPDDMDQLP